MEKRCHWTYVSHISRHCFRQRKNLFIWRVVHQYSNITIVNLKTGWHLKGIAIILRANYRTSWLFSSNESIACHVTRLNFPLMVMTIWKHLDCATWLSLHDMSSQFNTLTPRWHSGHFQDHIRKLFFWMKIDVVCCKFQQTLFHKAPHWQYVRVISYNGLPPNRWQTIMKVKPSQITD